MSTGPALQSHNSPIPSGIRRINPQTVGEHWGIAVAKEVLRLSPDRTVYTCAAGISPSGVVHFGNFRDLLTSWVVMQGLKELGAKTRLLFSWDDFDRLRKVPAGIDPSWRQHIGRPLSVVPDPDGAYESYAQRFERDFEAAMAQLDIAIEYRYQSKEYQSGRYDDHIIHALRRRTEIADILLSFMSEKSKVEKEVDEVRFRETFFPVSVYSEVTGTDDTEVLDFDGERVITYRCRSSGEERRVDLRTNHIVKLPWKVDWPMRWMVEGVVFEPGGLDHATPGGSFDVASEIAPKIFSFPPPLFVEYKFVGIRGAGIKMSGSKGNAITPLELLRIYEPSLLLWLYTRKDPGQEFSLSFDSEIFRQYDEFDRELELESKGALAVPKQQALHLALGSRGRSGVVAGGSGTEAEQGRILGAAGSPEGEMKPISFRQAVGLGQILQWNGKKLLELNGDLQMGFNPDSLERRLPLAQQWLETYNPGEMIKLVSEPNIAYWQSLSLDDQSHVVRLYEELVRGGPLSPSQLEELVYRIPKDPELPLEANKPRQRAFFKHVYNLLIGSDTGPRLATFLWAIEREEVLQRLRFG